NRQVIPHWSSRARKNTPSRLAGFDNVNARYVTETACKRGVAFVVFLGTQMPRCGSVLLVYHKNRRKSIICFNRGRNITLRLKNRLKISRKNTVVCF
ncbi:MAG: hypothetical protein J0G97_08705, partial [Rhizobium pusense]|nr:hypothetical protein [Agrobacterium pusense]